MRIRYLMDDGIQRIIPANIIITVTARTASAGIIWLYNIGYYIMVRCKLCRLTGVHCTRKLDMKCAPWKYIPKCPQKNVHTSTALKILTIIVIIAFNRNKLCFFYLFFMLLKKIVLQRRVYWKGHGFMIPAI